MATYMIDGRLTADAVIKANTEGKESMRFSIAWNRKNKDAHFYNCSMTGDRATKLLPYMKKGKYVIIVGEPDWYDYNGKTYEVIRADKINFVSEARQESDDLKSPISASGESKWGFTYPYTENGHTFHNDDEYDKYQWEGIAPENGPESFSDSDFTDIPFDL